MSDKQTGYIQEWLFHIRIIIDYCIAMCARQTVNEFYRPARILSPQIIKLVYAPQLDQGLHTDAICRWTVFMKLFTQLPSLFEQK